jgi:3-hydroxyacyl-CoA dehydrogenase
VLGRRRHGGADRRPLRQRRRAGRPVRPAGQGRRPNGIVDKALDGLKKLDPAPFATKDRAQYIDAANYGSDLDKLRDCDLVIEAIAEKMEWKLDLYAKVAPTSADAIFASNTSGLSINALAEGMPADRAAASAASTSSTRRATCRWSS